MCVCVCVCFGDTSIAAASAGGGHPPSSRPLTRHHFDNLPAIPVRVYPFTPAQLGYSAAEVRRYLDAYWGSLLGQDGSGGATSAGPPRNVVQELAFRGSSYFTNVFAQVRCARKGGGGVVNTSPN